MRSSELFSSNYRSRTGKTPITRGLIKGLIYAVVLTLVSVVLFALIMRAVKPSDIVVSVFNQLLKLAAILVGVWMGVGRGGANGASRGALIGLTYMALGVGLYALLSGQPLSWLAYLADLGMGFAAGGLSGLVVSNLSPSAK